MAPEARGDGFITIGEKLENPLSVENMKEALADLKACGPINIRGRAMMRAVFGELNSLGEIKATHHYMKFSPQSLEELYLLREDTTLFFSHLPLDHEIIGEGILPYVPADFDPETWEIMLNAPISPLYAYVSVTKSFPADISYEILDELYIPCAIDDEIAAKADVQPLSDELTGMLTDRAVRIIGGGVGDPIEAAPWYPSGKIQVYDTELRRYVGVQSVRVHARSPRGTHDWEYTAKDGNFKLKTGFVGQVQYSIEWGSREYEIQNAADQQATYFGAMKTGPWELNISDGESRG